METIYTPEEIQFLDLEFKKEAEAEFVEMVKSMLDENPAEIFIEYDENDEIEAIWF